MLAHLCLMWLVWLEWNRWTFEGLAVSVPCLKNKLLVVLHRWVSGTMDLDVFVFLDSLSLGFLIDCNYWIFVDAFLIILFLFIKK